MFDWNIEIFFVFQFCNTTRCPVQKKNYFVWYRFTCAKILSASKYNPFQGTFFCKVAKNVSGGSAVLLSLSEARNTKQIQHLGYTTWSVKPGVCSGTANTSLGTQRLKADSHIACCAHALPLPCLSLIHTCHATPLLCSETPVSFVKFRVVAGNIRTASPTV